MKKFQTKIIPKKISYQKYKVNNIGKDVLQLNKTIFKKFGSNKSSFNQENSRYETNIKQRINFQLIDKLKNYLFEFDLNQDH